MKKRILLVDESLTVQKVVALTLDKGRYQVSYARSRQEVIKSVLDELPHLILLSDGVQELPWQSFPKELEAWLGRNVQPPPVILITNQDFKEARHYAACLKKPFTPQNLQAVVEAQVGMTGHEEPVERTDTRGFTENQDSNFEEDRLQRVFNNAFSNEESLMKETFESRQGAGSGSGSSNADSNVEDNELEEDQSQTVFDARSPKNRAQSSRRSEPPVTASSLWEDSSTKAVAQRTKTSGSASHAGGQGPEDLWGMNAAVVHSRAQDPAANEPSSQILSAEDSMAYKSVLEGEVQNRLERQDLEEIVSRTLNKLMPPIVEKLVQERLDLLLKEHEESVSP